MQKLICAAGLALVTVILAACGGGGGGGDAPLPATAAPAPRPPVRLAFPGDSLTDGFPGARPVERIAQQLGGRIEAVSLGVSGTAAVQFLEGISPLPGVTFAQWAATTDAQAVVVRYGGIEALYDPTHNLMAGFGASIEAIIDIAHARGIGVVLVGKITLPVNEVADEAFQARYAATDATLREIAARRGVPYIDVSTVPVYDGEMADPIHPAQAYQNRVSDVIAAGLAPIIESAPWR